MERFQIFLFAGKWTMVDFEGSLEEAEAAALKLVERYPDWTELRIVQTVRLGYKKGIQWSPLA